VPEPPRELQKKIISRSILLKERNLNIDYKLNEELFLSRSKDFFSYFNSFENKDIIKSTLIM
jgi:hypothetical protein